MSFWSDVGNGAASVGSAVGDAVESAVDTVVDVVEDTVDVVEDVVEDVVDTVTEWVDDVAGPIAGGAANVVGGIVTGIVAFVVDLVHGVANIVRDVAQIVGSVLRLDFAGALAAVGDLLGHIVGILGDVLRFLLGGYVVGGIVRQFQRSALRRFVSALVDSTFASDTARRDAIRQNIGLDGPGGFGLPLNADHRIFMLDSANTDLAAMQAAGELDLFQMAGLLSFESFELWPNPRTIVTTVDASGRDNWFPVNRFVIGRYLESNGREGRLRVYALDRPSVAENMRVMSEKFKQLGIRLSWTHWPYYGRFLPYLSHEIGRAEFRFSCPRDNAEPWLISEGLRTADPDDDGTVLALCAFRFEPINNSEKFGFAYGRDIDHFPSTCSNPSRDDDCCSVIERVVNRQDRGSGVIYRDAYPSWIFKYVLSHEGGHYMGLCHVGHGINEIMWTSASGQDTATINWRILFWYLDGEPRFTFADACNCWRFLVDQMPHVLDG